MRQVPIVAVFEDGSIPAEGTEPLVPYAQQVSVQQGTDTQLAITAVGTNGSAFSLSGAAIAFAARSLANPMAESLSITGVVVSAASGTATVDVSAAGIAGLDARAYSYVITVAISGATWPVVPEGLFAITPTTVGS